MNDGKKVLGQQVSKASEVRGQAAPSMSAVWQSQELLQPIPALQDLSEGVGTEGLDSGDDEGELVSGLFLEVRSRWS